MCEYFNECTTHFDVIYNQGNAVATTLRVFSSGFGSGIVLGNMGMFLNNFMNWSDLFPETTDDSEFN